MLIKKKEKSYLYNNNFAKLLQNMGLYYRVMQLSKKALSNGGDFVNNIFIKDLYRSELSSLFTWAQTKEGQDYWSNVSRIINKKLREEEYEKKKRRDSEISRNSSF